MAAAGSHERVGLLVIFGAEGEAKNSGGKGRWTGRGGVDGASGKEGLVHWSLPSHMPGKDYQEG